MEDENDINQMADNLINNALEGFQNQINNYTEKLLNEQIKPKLVQYNKNLNNQIENYTQVMLNKVINDKDFILRNKKIDLKEMDLPPLTRLAKLDNTNYLTNLILQCLSNTRCIISYFFNEKKEGKILQNSKNNPNGTYLCPSFLKLLDNLWKNNIYQPKEIHEILIKLMENKYNSLNPGQILNFIILELHKELISSKDFLEKPDGNFDEKRGYDHFIKYFNHYKSKLSVEFFATFIIIKKPPGKPNFYIFETSPVIDIYLDNGNSPVLSLENNFKDLFKNFNEQMNQGYIQKSMYNIAKQLIININRGNNQRIFTYPLTLESKNLLYNNSDIGKYDLYCVIMKENNKYLALIKNFINSKWYEYKDEEIKLVNDANKIINKRNALLLIYQKQNIKY